MRLRTFFLAPIIVLQALWVAARAARLPEAGGRRTGEIGQGPTLRLLVLGDSSAAGVGVTDQSQALGGQLAAKMAEQYSVRWSVVAKSGGTVRSTTRMINALPPGQFDIVIIALGVNDTKNGVSVKNWTEGYRHLLDLISAKFEASRICVSGLPPISHFPILPRPLNRVLGDRADLFDICLRELVQARSDTVYLPVDLTMDPSKMARDGFHPGPEIYDAWAERAARLITKEIA